MLPHVNNIKNLILATIIVIKNMCCILIFVNFLVCKKIHNKENEKPLKKKRVKYLVKEMQPLWAWHFFYQA